MSFPIYAGWTPDPSWATHRQVADLLATPELWNLAWLFFPQVDELARPNVEGVTRDFSWLDPILDNRDVMTMAALRLPPYDFLEFWDEHDDGDLAMTEGTWNYRQRMEARAKEASNRLYPRVHDTVVRVDFHTRRVVR